MLDYNYKNIQDKFNRQSIPGKLSYKLDNNTYALKSDNNEILIKFHDTIIGILQADKIILNSGGYKTYTTKERINHILSDNNTSLSLYQVNNIWWIYSRKEDKYKFQDNLTLLFNGIDYQVLNYAVDNTKELNHLKYQLKKYTDKYWKAFQEGLIYPDNGDCLYCRFNWNDSDHLISHIKEDYYPGYLIYSAYLNDNNHSMLSHDLIASWINKDKNTFQQLIKIVGYQVKKSLYKYMINNLIKSG